MNDVYTAGLFDGEGSVSLALRSKKYKTRTPAVSVTSTTFEIVDYLFRNYGGKVVVQTEAKPPCSKAWIWSLHNYAAIEFLKRIRPYMIEPEKVRRADMIINEYRQVTKRNGFYTPEDWQKKMDFQKEFFKNSKKVNL